MKVYINVLILAFLSILLTGCTGNKKKIEYAIVGSGSVASISGSVSVQDSTNIAYINQFSGSVILDNATVAKGAIIHENSILVTGSGAEAEIIFADNSIVRLSQNSRLQISKKGADNTVLDLQEGSVWARVLKPFTDASFFTLETDDLSAGVRGTSIWMMTDSGGTDVGVVDTTSIHGGLSGALIEVVDKAYFGTGDVHLSQENVLRVRHSKPLEHKKVKLTEQIKTHPFIGVNTVRDIRYMNSLIEKNTSQTGSIQIGTIDRIRKEMEVTMPSSEEIVLYMTDPVIRNEVERKDIKELTPKKFIEYIDLNEKIDDIIKSDIKKVDKEEKIQEIRKLIRNTKEDPELGIEKPKENIKRELPIVPIKTELPPIKPVIPPTVSGEKVISKISPIITTTPPIISADPVPSITITTPPATDPLPPVISTNPPPTTDPVPPIITTTPPIISTDPVPPIITTTPPIISTDPVSPTKIIEKITPISAD